jgi:hypothetical protein
METGQSAQFNEEDGRGEEGYDHQDRQLNFDL